jgi:hypothetical protein
MIWEASKLKRGEVRKEWIKMRSVEPPGLYSAVDIVPIKVPSGN